MIIKSIELQNYRNYTKETIDFSPHINIFLGENAQGKTNLIESIHVLALTKSHRTNNDKELIYWDKEFSKITAKIEKKNQEMNLKLVITPKGKKASVGLIEQKKLSNYIGQFNIVLFAPEDLAIVKGAPNYRRRFIDIELGQINPIYLYHLTQYQKILKQRNLYLKESKINDTYLLILTEQLAKNGSILLYHRLNFIKLLEKWAKKFNHTITQGKDLLQINYISQIDYYENDTEDNLYKKLFDLFEKNLKREIEKRVTLYGPHRDDISFFVNEKNVQIYGSQGQQRTTALSIKLAEIDLIKEVTGDYPVLLLDDVLSELDDFRQTYLLKSIENKVQTFVTTTNLDGIEKNNLKKSKIFFISQGKVNERDR